MLLLTVLIYGFSGWLFDPTVKLKEKQCVITKTFYQCSKMLLQLSNILGIVLVSITPPDYFFLALCLFSLTMWLNKHKASNHITNFLFFTKTAMQIAHVNVTGQWIGELQMNDKFYLLNSLI